MQGLLQQAAPEQQAPAPQQAAPQQAAPQPGGQQGGPNQEKYDIAAGTMIKWVYDNAETVVQNVSAGEPAERAGQIISQLMNMNRMSAQQSGQVIEPSIMFQSGIETAQAVGEVLLKAGVISPDNAGPIMEDAFFNALELQGQSATISDQERQEYLALIDQYQGKGAM